MDWLMDMLGLNAGKATMKAATKNEGIVNQYGVDAGELVTEGADQAGGYLQQILGLQQPMAEAGRAGAGLYADALGINGAEGAQRATGAFQTGPGYQFQMDQGLQALQRIGSAKGNLQSGNTDVGVMRYASGLADQSWGSWLDRLANPSSPLNSAVSGQTSTLGNLADLALDTSGKRIGIRGEVANGLMGANNQYASGKETNAAGFANLGKTIIGMGSKALGYGGF